MCLFPLLICISSAMMNCNYKCNSSAEFCESFLGTVESEGGFGDSRTAPTYSGLLGFLLFLLLVVPRAVGG